MPKVKDEKVEMFDGSNYNSWSSDIKFLLMEKGLWEYCTDKSPLLKKKKKATKVKKEPSETKGAESSIGNLEKSPPAEKSPKEETDSEDTDSPSGPDERKDLKAQGCIGRSLEKAYRSQLDSCNNAYEVWENLKSLYQDKHDVGTVWTHLAEFMEIKMDPNEDVVAYIGKLERLQTLSVDSPCPIPVNLMITKVIQCLPESWKSFAQSMRANPDLFNMSFSTIKTRLVAEQNLRRAEAAHNETENKPKAALRSERTNVKCENCSKKGHSKKDCWAKGGDKEGQGPQKQKRALTTESSKPKAESSKPKAAFCATRTIEWIMDSGCTDHMISTKDTLIRETNLTESVKIADGTKIQALSVGEIELEQATLKNVWFVPKLGRNLLSVSAIDKMGYTVTFQNKSVLVSTKDGKEILKGKLENDLYIIDTKKESKSFIAEKELTLWHKRLGHAHEDAVREATNNFNKSDSLPYCDSCKEGKMSKQTFNSKKEKSTEPIEVLHTDLCGPMETTGIEGEKYFMAITDEATDFTMTFTLANKESSKTLECIKEAITYLERQTGNKVKKVKCDGGKEFINNNWESYFSEKGILLDSSNPYTPEQNGIAERKNQTLVEAARTMMCEANLKKEFWAEAIKTATYIRNRVPTRSDKKSAYERLFHKTPNLKNLKVFGSQCHSFINKSLRKKFDKKSRKCILIGYTTNGYKLYELVTGKITYSRHVIFNESSWNHQRTMDK